MKDLGGETAAVEEFTDRGFAVASINIRSSSDARFPAQGFDVRAAIRYLRESAATYGIDPERFAFMGNSSGGWATAFAAATSDTLELEGETGVDGTSSAVRVAVAFFPPTDFLSIDAFVAANDLSMNSNIYPIDKTTSPAGLLIQCPTEGPSEGPPDMGLLVSIQDCPDETEKADPATYIDEAAVPIWLLHGLTDSDVPYDQSQLLYDAAVAEGSEARLTWYPERDTRFPTSSTLRRPRPGRTTAIGKSVRLSALARAGMTSSSSSEPASSDPRVEPWRLAPLGVERGARDLLEQTGPDHLGCDAGGLASGLIAEGGGEVVLELEARYAARTV